MPLTLIDNRYLIGFSIAENFETRLVARLSPYHSITVGAGLDLNSNGIPDGEEPPVQQDYLRNGENWSIRSIDDVGDFNGDGYTDLLYERQFTYLPPTILLGSADGSMTEATILGDAARETLGEAFHADFNGDGLIDIYGTVNGYAHRYPTTPSNMEGSFASGGDLLLTNQGNNTFVAQAVPSMLQHQTGFDLHYNHGGHFGDWDNDGDMDVLAIEANGLVGPDEGVITDKRIALNNGDGTFTYSSSKIPGTTAQPDPSRDNQFGQTPSARFADLNNDGIVDLAINTGAYGESALASNGGLHIYINDGDGDISNDQVIKTKTHWAVTNKEYLQQRYSDLDFSTAWFSSDFTSYCDVNDDGYLDILVGQKVGFDGYSGTAGGFQLFINNKGESFVESTSEYFPNLEIHYKLGDTSIPDVTRFNFADINGDGKKDFILEQGHNIDYDDGIYPYIMLNFDDKFYPISDADAAVLVSRGEASLGNFVTGDFNGDGRIDFASIGGVRDDLPGVWQDERATADGIFLHLGKTDSATNSNLLHRGTGQSDVLNGTSKDERYVPGKGADIIAAGAGLDTVIYWSDAENFDVTRGPESTIVSFQGSEDILTGVERLEFNDKLVALDLAGPQSAGATYRLYQAAFDRAPDQRGLGYWIAEVDKGMSLEEIAFSFINSDEFRTLYGTNPTDEQFITLLYNNVLNRDPDIAGFDYWMNDMRDGLSRAGVLSSFSESAENQENVSANIVNGFEYLFWEGP